MIAHRWAAGRLDAYVDRELEQADRERVETHLHDCWACSGQVQTRLGIKTSLRRLGRARPREIAQVRLQNWATEQFR